MLRGKTMRTKEKDNRAVHLTHHTCNILMCVCVWDMLTFFRMTKSFSRLFLLLISSSYLWQRQDTYSFITELTAASFTTTGRLFTCVCSPPPGPACSSAPRPVWSCRCWPGPSDASDPPCRPRTGAPRWIGRPPGPAAAPASSQAFYSAAPGNAPGKKWDRRCK